MTLPVQIVVQTTPSFAASEGSIAQRNDAAAGELYIRHNGTWYAAARIGDAASFTGLTLTSGFGTAGVVHNNSSGVFSSSLIVNADITAATITPTKWDPTGLSANQTWVWNGSIFVATTVTGGGGTITSVTAGAGLTGGGSSGGVTLDVIANADGSIVVNANDIQVGVLATNAQHGNRGGGALHSAVTNAAAGFAAAITGAFLPLVSNSSGVSAAWGQVSDAGISDVTWGKITTGKPTTLAGYGITDAVANTINVIAGAGLTGGGALSANVTLNVIANADGSIVVNANDLQVGILASDAQHGTRGGGTLHTAVTNTAAGFAPLISGGNRVLISSSVGTTSTWGHITDSMVDDVAWTKVSGYPTITTTAPLTIDGGASANLSVSRTLAVSNATTGAVGVVKLAQDLGGTGALPTVIGISGSSNVAPVHCTDITWDGNLGDDSTLSISPGTGNGDGNTLGILGQDGHSGGASQKGGRTYVASGSGVHGGVAGPLEMMLGATVMLQLVEVAAGKRVTGINQSTSLTTATTGTAPGDLVAHIGLASTLPTLPPVSGALLWADAGSVFSLDINNLRTTVAGKGPASSGRKSFSDVRHGTVDTTASASGTVLSINFDDYGASSGKWTWSVKFIVHAFNMTDNVTEFAWERIYTGQCVSGAPSNYGNSSEVQASSGAITTVAGGESASGSLRSFTNIFDILVGATAGNSYRWFAQADVRIFQVA